MTLSELKRKMTRQHDAIIVDYDGTLARRGDREPYEWTRVGEDEPILPVIFVVQHLSIFCQVLIVSGRDEICRQQSEMWLHAQNITWARFFMRPKGDNRSDDIVKREIYETHIQKEYNVIAAFDDRPSVVRLWQSLGIWTFDCNNGRGEF